MIKLPSINFLGAAFLKAWQRFPLSMIAAIVGTLAMIQQLEVDREYKEIPLRIFMSALLALPLCTGVTAWAESRKITLSFQLIVQAIAIGISVFFYFYLNFEAIGLEHKQLPRYFVSLAIAHLWVSFSPYIKNESVEDFWEYNKQLFGNYIIGAAYTLLLYAGIAVAHLAVNELFNLDLNSDNYAKLFFLLAGIFNTAYFLFHFPKDYQFDRSESAYNASFFNLCKYILVPIIGLYFLILYAYSAKIGLTWSLPHGWVSSLVIGFAAAGIFTWLISYLLPDQIAEKSIINNYRKWFWLVLFPLIGLLYVAIGKRIMDYGVTEARFLVAHIGAWLLLCCIFFVIVKSNDLKFIPMSLAAFMLVGIVGPFSAFESSKRSQTKILEQILTKDGMLVGGKVKDGKCTEPEKVISAIRFLENRNALEKIQPWFKVNFDSMSNVSNRADKTSIIANILKIETSSSPQDFMNSWSINSESNLKSIVISGFDEFTSINWYDYNNEKGTRDIFMLNAEGTKLEYRTLDNNDQPILSEVFDLQPFMKSCFPVKDKDSNPIFTPNTIFDLEGTTCKFRVSIHNATFIETKGDYQFQNFQGEVFFTRK
jgi:Domain of unknown function (DUF4153)